jgi:hypothetical protein
LRERERDLLSWAAEICIIKPLSSLLVIWEEEEEEEDEEDDEDDDEEDPCRFDWIFM